MEFLLNSIKKWIYFSGQYLNNSQNRGVAFLILLNPNGNATPS
jgi:hypothetical protein